MPFSQLPFITYGTTRLGDKSIPEADRVKLTLEVIKTGAWLHTSAQYGDAESILGQAFKQAPAPKLMIKIQGNNIAEMRADIQRNISTMGVPGVEIGQLCPGGDISKELTLGGAVYEELQKIKAEGLVKTFVLEVFPWTSETAFKALKYGHLEGTVDALIFYFNPLQRFASNKLWELLESTGFPFLALRTVAGGDVHALRDVPGAAWRPYLHDRAVEVAPIFERSGIKTWAEFCVRFAASYPQVLGTIVASSKMERVNHLLDCAAKREPLPLAILDEISALQRRWSDEVDMKAEVWTM